MRCRDASLTHPKRFAPPWGFQEKVPGEEGMALVSPICVNVMFCVAGFRPGRRRTMGDEPFRAPHERARNHIFGLMRLLPARDSSGNPVYNRSHMKNIRCSC